MAGSYNDPLARLGWRGGGSARLFESPLYAAGALSVRYKSSRSALDAVHGLSKRAWWCSLLLGRVAQRAARHELHADARPESGGVAA